MRILAGLIVVALVFVGFLVFRNQKIDVKYTIPEILNISTPAPTPFPFQELTIPYLRQKDYKSLLGNLNVYQEKPTYTSYLTSYTSDGLRINGLLTIPKGEIPSEGFPAIVFVHGYIAPSVYKTTEKYADYVDFLARNGFVVFKIDLRGHDESEGEAGGAYYSGDYVTDTLSAYKALQGSDFVNPEAIGLWGHSMAGNVTFRSFVVGKDIPALVVWAGAGYSYEDLREYRIMDTSYRAPDQTTDRAKQRKLLNDTYGTFDPASTFWKQVPGTNYLEGVSGAVEVHHAIDDNVVSIEYSRNLMKILGNYPITHQLFEYTTGGHNLTGSSFTKAMEETVKFFKENLR